MAVIGTIAVAEFMAVQPHSVVKQVKNFLYHFKTVFNLHAFPCFAGDGCGQSISPEPNTIF